jgi:tRNA G18 (ribose-2'-O)-methylase SpoU
VHDSEPLTHADDPRLESYRNSRWNRQPDATTHDFIVEGRYCVERLLQSDYEVHSVLVAEGKSVEIIESLNRVVPVYSLAPAEIRKLVGFDFHRGIMACAKRPALKPMAVFEQEISRPEIIKPEITIALLGLCERENVGSIMRTAAALGVERILLGPNTADPFARRTIRVSMGTVFRLKLYELSDAVGQLQDLAERHALRTIVTTLDRSATPLRDFRLARESGILIAGNEAEGVAEEIQKAATDRVIIPMSLGTNSLNVAVATAICLHELSNQLNH